MKAAIAFGTFDGLHAGHRAVLEATVGMKRIAVTFSTPPKFSKNGGGQLMSLEDRKRGLKELGIDEIECLQFEYFKDMSPVEFLDFCREHFDLGRIACGYNFKFGKGASGNTETIKEYCNQYGIEFVCAKPVEVNGKPVSSSVIRELIKNGEILEANEYLYHPFRFTAEVLQGDMRGRTIGFPTINQLIPKELVTPKCGVYESRVIVGGNSYKAISNIGFRPTYKTEFVTSETHIIGFSGDVYGKEVSVYPERYIREEKKFSSLEELKKAIKNDYSEVVK